MILNSKKAQSLTEYLILTALISVGSIAVIQLISRNLRTKFAVVSEAIRGVKKPEIVGDGVSEKHYQKLNMSDFAEAAEYHDK